MTRSLVVRRTLQALGLLILAVSLTGLGALYYVGHLWSNHGRIAPVQETRELVTAAFHPEQLFPGQSQITVLCMGLDRNWTEKDLPYSRGTRTDTMIAFRLDLNERKVYALSIPRDLRVEIPEHGFSKINDAYRFGGIPLTIETVKQFLGVDMDYFVLVKLDAVKRFVNAIGGVTVDVEKDMDYDDNWGQLHIHLKKGPQRLNGEQIEGYMRYRHDAESDFGRMRRQQQAIRAVMAELQTPRTAMRIPQLIDAFNEKIETNLRRDQILGLASLFHEVHPEEVIADALPGRDRMMDGISYLEPMPKRQATLVDWLLKGDDTAANRLTTVRVLNACRSRKTTEWVVHRLEEQSFNVTYAGRAREETTVTRIEGTGRHKDAAQRVLSALELDGVVAPVWESSKEDPVITVTVGQDQMAKVPTEPAPGEAPG